MMSLKTGSVSGDEGPSMLRGSAVAILDINSEYEGKSSEGEGSWLFLMSSGGVGRSGDEWREEIDCSFSEEDVMSTAEDLEPEGLTVAEEYAEQLEMQTPELPPDSPPPVDRLRARLRGRLMTKRSEDCSVSYTHLTLPTKA